MCVKYGVKLNFHVLKFSVKSSFIFPGLLHYIHTTCQPYFMFDIFEINCFKSKV